MTREAVDISIVVPVYRAEGTLPSCIRSLLQQDFDGTYEVVVVLSADDEALLPNVEAHPLMTVIPRTPRMPAATARNLGVSAARGAMLAFTDADAVADPNWLRNLVAASGGGRWCVAGSVRNGTPWSLTGTTEYLMSFLDLHPVRPAGTAWHGATCNLLVSRAIWARYGPWPEDLTGGEDTLMTARARAEDRFRFAPEAEVAHLNRTRLSDIVRHQYEAGVFTAHVGRRGPYKMRPLVRFSPLAPLAAVGRIASLYARVAVWTTRDLPKAVLLFPLVALGLMGWGAGLLTEGARLDLERLRRALWK